jgi:alginate O-acetyltransferase complex protein AlgI
MLFNSLHFAFFFPIVTCVYFSVPERYCWTVLLLASFYFYMSWNSYLIIILMISTGIDYHAAILIEDCISTTMKKTFLLLSLCANLGLLFIFKYMNFFLQTVGLCADYGGFDWHLPVFSVVLPVGISFYTFQAMSYTIDVYKGASAERNFGRFLLFITFFPQLVAGPIERASGLLGQFVHRMPFSYHNAVVGLRTALGGLMLKVVVADNLSPYVDSVYNNVHDYTGWPLLFATYLFAFQIFCDFAGYSYMAIGIARVMGFTLMENFRQPYCADSVTDFWRRWHISLSSWFRDYVYIPLGGSRYGTYYWMRNMLVTFLISGLWHGASWTFVIWGGLNGIFIIVEHLIPLSIARSVPMLCKRLCTFGCICFSWIFFRANSFSDALYIITHITNGLYSLDSLLLLRRAMIAGRTISPQLLLVLTIGVLIAQVIQVQCGHIRYLLSTFPRAVRLGFYYAAITLIFLMGEFGGNQFIYFQF